jgi:hypothetical protein
MVGGGAGVLPGALAGALQQAYSGAGPNSCGFKRCNALADIAEIAAVAAAAEGLASVLESDDQVRARVCGACVHV